MIGISLLENINFIRLGYIIIGSSCFWFVPIADIAI